MSLVAETATLVHGYTMADLEKAAHICSNKAWARILSESDRYECAWHAIAELLYSTNTPPSFYELLDAGRAAINEESQRHWQSHGIDRNTYEPAPGFARYWNSVAPQVGRHGRWPEDFTESTIERMALPQVLALLTAAEYQAITALAVHGTRTKARDALGIAMSTLDQRLKAARNRINTAWFAPDRPPQRRDDACRAGHSRAVHGFTRADGKTYCRLCRRNSQRRAQARGYLPSAHEEHEARDRKIVELWSTGGLTMEEIGTRAGCSEATVSRVVRRDLGDDAGYRGSKHRHGVGGAA